MKKVGFIFLADNKKIKNVAVNTALILLKIKTNQHVKIE